MWLYTDVFTDGEIDEMISNLLSIKYSSVFISKKALTITQKIPKV